MCHQGAGIADGGKQDMQYGIKTHQGQCRQNRVVRKSNTRSPMLCFLLRFTLNCLISSITFPLSLTISWIQICASRWYLSSITARSSRWSLLIRRLWNNSGLLPQAPSVNIGGYDIRRIIDQRIVEQDNFLVAGSHQSADRKDKQDDDDRTDLRQRNVPHFLHPADPVDIGRFI